MTFRALLLSALYVATAQRSFGRRPKITESSRTQERGLPGAVPHACPCSPRPRKRGTLHDRIRVCPRRPYCTNTTIDRGPTMYWVPNICCSCPDSQMSFDEF
jgi:hypothetical protein